MADTAAWTRADQLLIGDQLSTITGTAKLQSVLYTTERVPVYNLSIPGSPTYYVGKHGVWVHNASPFDCFTSSRFPVGSKLQKAFAKHGADFGVEFSAKNVDVFLRNVEDYISSARSMRVNYRGQQSATMYFKGPNKPMVFVNGAGEWISGYKPTDAAKYNDIVNKGFVW